MGYDTIYGAQDMSDDEIIGLKSTSIKFKKNIKLFLTISYLFTASLIIFLFKDIIGFNISFFLLFLFLLSFLYQILKFNYRKPDMCLKIFKFNNYSGSLLFLSILTLNY